MKGLSEIQKHHVQKHDAFGSRLTLACLGHDLQSATLAFVISSVQGNSFTGLLDGIF